MAGIGQYRIAGSLQVRQEMKSSGFPFAMAVV